MSTNQAEIQILRQFKNQLIAFFDELVSQLPDEPDLVIMRIFFKDQIPVKEVMDYFIHSLLKIKEMIHNRDEQFFLNDNSLFQSLSKGKVNHFKRLWRSERLDNEDKETIWKWIDSLVFLASKYQKIMEGPMTSCDQKVNTEMEEQKS